MAGAHFQTSEKCNVLKELFIVEAWSYKISFPTLTVKVKGVTGGFGWRGYSISRTNRIIACITVMCGGFISQQLCSRLV